MATQSGTSRVHDAQPMMEEARESAGRVADQTRQAMQDVQTDPTPHGIMGAIESLPATAYMWAALGSIGVSLVLRLAGKKEFANFVGLWPPTIAVLALVNKQLRPSREL